MYNFLYVFFFTAEHYLSCHYFKIHSQNERSKVIKVDLDGSGPLRPFTIDCSMKIEDGKSYLKYHFMSISDRDIRTQFSGKCGVNVFDR